MIELSLLIAGISAFWSVRRAKRLQRRYAVGVCAVAVLLSPWLVWFFTGREAFCSIALVTLLSVLVCACLEFLIWLQNHRVGTRTARLERCYVRERRAGKRITKRYDVFLSYKSQDVAVVRPVAEQLLANGLVPWFNEYVIPFSGWEAFEEWISHGIEQSRYGVCFTNDQYVQSPYCRSELTQLLLPSNCSAERVFEVKCPDEPLPHEQFPELSSATSIVHADLDGVLRAIQDLTARRVAARPSPRPSPPAPIIFRYKRYRYWLDFTGWDVRCNLRGNQDVATIFQRAVNGRRFTGNLLTGPMDRGALRDDHGDDRAYYVEALRYADQFFDRAWRQRCVGLHLLFLHGFSHCAFTTLFRRGVWSRRYSVVLPTPDHADQLEFAFVFFFCGPFREFCRNAHLMDDVVRSLTWAT